MEVKELFHVEAFDKGTTSVWPMYNTVMSNTVPCLSNVCWMNKYQCLLEEKGTICLYSLSSLSVLILLQHPGYSSLLHCEHLRVIIGRPSYPLGHNNHWITICWLNDHVISAWVVPCVLLKLSDFLVLFPNKLLAPKGLELCFAHPVFSAAGTEQVMSEGLRELTFFQDRTESVIDKIFHSV